MTSLELCFASSHNHANKCVQHAWAGSGSLWTLDLRASVSRWGTRGGPCAVWQRRGGCGMWRAESLQKGHLIDLRSPADVSTKNQADSQKIEVIVANQTAYNTALGFLIWEAALFCKCKHNVRMFQKVHGNKKVSLLCCISDLCSFAYTLGFLQIPPAPPRSRDWTVVKMLSKHRAILQLVRGWCLGPFSYKE